MKYDLLLQKYLRGKATRYEKDILLDFYLKSLNKIIKLTKEFKMGVVE